MAVHKQTKWVNKSKPAIDANHLNNIENCLVGLTKTNVLNVDPIAGSGTGILARIGNVCTLTLSFIANKGSSEPIHLLSFPNGYVPLVDFTQLVTSTDGSEFETPVDTSIETRAINTNVAPYISHNAAENKLYLHLYSDENVSCKVTCTYLTENDFIGG